MNKEERIYKDLMKNKIYEDDRIIALNKPAGLASQGGNKVDISLDKIINLESEKTGVKYLLTHRLDRDTSGLIIMAKNKKVAQFITELFAKRKIQKTYLAITVNKPRKLHGVINSPVEAKKNARNAHERKSIAALTEYEVVDFVGKELSLFKLHPQTGRKHQLRIHLADIGCPILGDGKYGGREAFKQNLSKKMHLHAYQIRIDKYYGKPLVLEAPIAEKFRATMNELGFCLN
jgi:23S rRNA pseudouridine955/2504/2580 synthase